MANQQADEIGPWRFSECIKKLIKLFLGDQRVNVTALNCYRCTTFQNISCEDMRSEANGSTQYKAAFTPNIVRNMLITLQRY